MKTQLSALLILMQISQAAAVFDGPAGAVRPAAMGGAFTAIANDTNASFYNPAGLWQVRRPEVSAHYGLLQNGIDDGLSLQQSFFSWAQSSEKLNAGYGASYSSLKLSGLYQEQTFLAAWGQHFPKHKISVGAASKWMNLTYGEDVYSRNALDNAGNVQTGVADPLLAGGKSKSLWSFDLGFLAQLRRGLSLGLAAQNINRPNAGLQQESKIPSFLRAGGAYRHKRELFSADLIQKRVLQEQADQVLALGWEHAMEIENGLIHWRSGGAFGSRSLRNFTLGFGLRYDNIQIDYAFLLPLSGLEAGNNDHRLALTFRFDWPFRLAIR